MTLEYYSPKELEKITAEAEKLRQKYPYSESDVKGTLEDLKIEEPYQNEVLAKYRKKKEKEQIKIVNLKKKKRSLESEIIKEDLKKVGKRIKKIGFYTAGIPLGLNFTIPTMYRKTNEFDAEHPAGGYEPINLMSMFIFGEFLNAIGLCFAYAKLYEINPALAFAVGGIQLASNIGSGIYEYVGHIKKKVEEKSSKKSLEEFAED